LGAPPPCMDVVAIISSYFRRNKKVGVKVLAALEHMLNALISIKKALRKCTNKPQVIVDGRPWYRWALKRLELEYRHERFGMRNRVERFSRYLKERTIVFHHKLSARDHMQGIMNPKPSLNLFTIYYEAARTWGGWKMLIRRLSAD
jgi:hypothetical protein